MRAIGPSPARLEPHDATTWFPVPDPRSLPSLEVMLAELDAEGPGSAVASLPSDVIDLVVLEHLVTATPARAEPHDAAAWLPLPEDVHALPALGDLLAPSPAVTAALLAEAEAVASEAAAAAVAAAAPSPARAEPHDSTTWLPLPDPETLGPLHTPEPADRGDAERPTAPRRAARAARRPRIWAFVLLAAATVAGVVQLTGTDAPEAVAGTRPIPVTVDLDGQITTLSTTARTAAGLGRQLHVNKLVGVRHAPRRLVRHAYVVLRTRKSGQLVIDGHTVAYDSPSLTVAELLAASHVVLDGDDTAVPAPTSVLTDGALVTVVRVGAATKQTTEAVAFDTEMAPDPTLDIGQTREHRAGTPGVATLTWRARTENGVEVGQTLLSSVTTTAPISRVVGYGTRADPRWDELAQCESGGRWNTVDGGTPAYDGGLGIYRPNWAHYGGLEFAPNAGLATREEQIIVAQRIYDEYGWEPWGCARTLHWL